MDAIIVPPDITVLAFFGGGEPSCFHYFDCCFISGWKWWTQVSSIVINLWRKLLGSTYKMTRFSLQVQRVLGHNMLTHWTYEVRCGCPHWCSPGRFPTQWQCNTPLLVCLPWCYHEFWQWSPVWWRWLAIPRWGTSSKLTAIFEFSSPLLHHAVWMGHPPLMWMSPWISLGVKPLRLR